jgi:threonine aldolase
MLGGAMRQSGVLAAACRVALETMRERLAEDHQNARRLAEGLAEIPGIELDASRVVTNIVAFGLAAQKSGERFREGCLERGLLLSCYGGDWRRLRAVTHLNAGAVEVEAALRIVGEAARAA